MTQQATKNISFTQLIIFCLLCYLANPPAVTKFVTTAIELSQKAIEQGSKFLDESPTKAKPVRISTTTLRAARLKAFLDTIAYFEVGTSKPSGYKKLVFKGSFASFDRHPNKIQCAPIGGREICSSAAGRYQIINKTWYLLQRQLKLPDFSPTSQDRAAIQLIRQQGAMNDILSGRIERAACKVGPVWASFPCNTYNQNARSPEEIKATWKYFFNLELKK